MGGKASKQLERSNTLRKTQRKQFQNIKQKCEEINKAIKKLTPQKQTEDDYEELKSKIAETRVFLQNISPELIDKNTTLFDNYVNKCDAYAKALDEKFSKQTPEEIYTSPVKIAEPQVVQIEEEQASNQPEEPEEEKSPPEKKKVLKKRKSHKYAPRITKEEASFEEIHEMRMKMLPLRDEILVFKGAVNDRTYHYLEESMLRFIAQLENVEMHDLQNLKHERKVAIEYARESIEILKKIAGIKSPEERKLVRSKCIEEEGEEDYVFIKELNANTNNEAVEIRPETRADFRRLLESKLTVDPSKRFTVGLLKSKYEQDTEVDHIAPSRSKIVDISKSLEILELPSADETDYSTEDSMDDYMLEDDDGAKEPPTKVTSI